MPDNPPRYRAILTDAGAALEAKALAEDRAVLLTHIAVGDCNLEAVEPEPDATGLVHEVWRGLIEFKRVNPEDPNITNVSLMIPASVGGFWIREVGVFGHLAGSEEEILYMYANHAPYYKMLPADGQAVTHELTIPVIQSSNAEITIQVSDLGYLPRTEFYDVDAERRLWIARLTTAVLRNTNRLFRARIQKIRSQEA